MSNTLAPTEELLRLHTLYDLDRIIAEIDSGFPSIAKAIAQHLRGVIAAWPNVTIHDVGQLEDPILGELMGPA